MLPLGAIAHKRDIFPFLRQFLLSTRFRNQVRAAFPQLEPDNTDIA